MIKKPFMFALGLVLGLIGGPLIIRPWPIDEIKDGPSGELTFGVLLLIAALILITTSIEAAPKDN